MICGNHDLCITQTNALTGKNHTTAVHGGRLAFMAPELIIEELSIPPAGTDELKTVDLWAFFTIVNPDQSYAFQNDLKNIPNKVNSDMEVGFKQELRKQAYPSFSLKYLPVQVMFMFLNRKMTHHNN